MTYTLGTRSRAELEGVHPDLVRVVERAIEITEQDFTVFDGIRTVDEQRDLVVLGASLTMTSRHLTGHAVDLVPWIAGRPRWKWPPIYRVVEAVRIAARNLAVPVVWGCCWDADLRHECGDPEAVAERYRARRVAAGRRVFMDGPHIQLPKDVYP